MTWLPEPYDWNLRIPLYPRPPASHLKVYSHASWNKPTTTVATVSQNNPHSRIQFSATKQNFISIHASISLYIHSVPLPLQSPPLPLVIPPILRRRIRRDPKLHNRIPKNRLSNRPLVKPLTRKPQFLARIPHLIVLPLEFVFPLLPLRGLVQFPRSMDRPVPEHAHCAESKWAGGFGMLEGVADQFCQISIG